MKNIDQHIKYLLSSNDCVILPNFGGFIAEYKTADINESNNKPRKSILFNTHLTRNDGLLINALVEQEGISYQEAKQNVSNYIAHISTALEQGESYTIESLGRFSLDLAGFIQFTEDENNTCFLNTYGLPAVELEKIERKTNKDTHLTRQKIIDYSLKTSAAVILILVVFFASQSNLKDNHTDQASLNFINDTPKSAILETPTVPQALAPKDSNKLDTTTTQDTPSPIHIEKEPTRYYHVIIGSLSNQPAAELHLNNYRQNYPFKDIKILESSGRFRISAAHFAQLSEANNYIRTLKELNPEAFKDAWALRQ